MEETDKDWMMIRMVGGWVFLLVPAHTGSPGQRTIKLLLLLLYVHTHKFIACEVCVILLIVVASSSVIENNCVNFQIITTLSPCDCMTLESFDRFVLSCLIHSDSQLDRLLYSCINTNQCGLWKKIRWHKQHTTTTTTTSYIRLTAFSPGQYG